MNLFRALKALMFSTKPRFSDIAIGNMTDIQMRRSGLNKAATLHHTFSGLSTCS